LYLGLKYAIKSAQVVKDTSSLNRWKDVLEELEAVLVQKFYDPECKRWTSLPKYKGRCDKGSAGYNSALLLWPAELVDYASEQAKDAGEDLWKFLEPSFDGKRTAGSYEPYGILSLAKLCKSEPEKIRLLKKALNWEATVPATKTGHLGEVWLKVNGKVSAGEAQPQLWHHALFYLSALEIYGVEE